MWAQFNYFDIKMTLKQAQLAVNSGVFLEGVRDILELPMIKRQVSRINDKKLFDALSEYGSWSDEEIENPEDREDNELRIVWVAARYIVEEAHNTKTEQEDKINRRKGANDAR